MNNLTDLILSNTIKGGNELHLTQLTDSVYNKMLAIYKIIEVTEYLNNGWKPDWNNYTQFKWHLYVNGDNQVRSDCHSTSQNIVYFKSKEAAQQTINILGEDTIRIALM